MRFFLEIVSDDAALNTEDDSALYELQRLCRQVGERVACGEGIAVHGNVRDINGNTVGSFEVTP